MGNTPVNRIIFPSPKPPTYNKQHISLINVPKGSNESHGSIPCMYLPSLKPSAKIMIYYHGNAEDIGCTTDFLIRIRNKFNFHVLAVEYPGYGTYEGVTTSDKIKADCHIIWKFLVDTISIDPEKIYVFGRSIGSGPAIHMGSCYDPAALMLFAPYTSIRDIAKDYTFLGGMIQERFNNAESIKQVNSPIWFQHGKEDEVINYNHSQKLSENCNTFFQLNLQADMTHNFFDMEDDMLVNQQTFLNKINCKTDKIGQFIDYTIFSKYKACIFKMSDEE